MSQKRVVAINDISCMGRAALTVVHPILSAAGIETSLLPTVLLSTHTGFEGFTYRDLTEDMRAIIAHWASLKVNFDGIFTGFMSSLEQIELTCSFIDKCKKKNTLVAVDPIMADGGKLYSVFKEDFPKMMRKLCEKADIITPNLTEACFLVEEEYREGVVTKSYIEGLLKKLSLLGVNNVILTSVSLQEGQIGVAAYDKTTKEIIYGPSTQKVPGTFIGTGDVFSSVLFAELLKGANLENAISLATKFTTDSVMRSEKEKLDKRFGLNFEDGLRNLNEVPFVSNSRQ